MLDFGISYFSVFPFDGRKDAPEITEVLYDLKKSPYFNVVDTDYTPKDYKLGEEWSFSVDLAFPDGKSKEFTFMLRKMERSFEFFKKENDLFNSYIMSPKKVDSDDWFFWDLGILTDLREDEMEGFHKQFKVVATFDSSPVYRDNSAYKIWEMEKAIHFAKRKSEPDHKEGFMVHYVYKEIVWGNKNWLHTHWLERFWFSEVEILDVPESFINPSLSLINNIASYIMENWEPMDWDSLDVWNGVEAFFVPYQVAIDHMKWAFFGKYTDRFSHWDILSNVLMTRKNKLFSNKHEFESISNRASVYFDNPFLNPSSSEVERVKAASDEFIADFWEIFEKHKDNPKYDFTLRFRHKIKDEYREDAGMPFAYLSYRLLEKKWNKVKVLDLEKCEYITQGEEPTEHTKNVKDIIEWAIVHEWETIVSDNLYKLKD